ncbi:hypothetical protein [Duck adenovirus 1]|nr:hypothetical protein [Duck adenovirus 1]
MASSEAALRYNTSALYLLELFYSGYDLFAGGPHCRHDDLRLLTLYDQEKNPTLRLFLSAGWYCDRCRPVYETELRDALFNAGGFYIKKDGDLVAHCDFQACQRA